MHNKTRGRHSLVSLTITATLGATMLRASPQVQPSASTPPVIRQMIEQAQHELAGGNAAASADLFEQAAEHGEYAEAEVGEVRARLWAGQFRHAVAISSVVAGEHPESAEAQALLGYIEDRNGYTAQALQRLRNEQRSRPQEAAPVAAEAEVLIDRHSAGDAINLIDQWVAAYGRQPDLCRLRSRAVLVQTFEVGAVPRLSNPCEIPAVPPPATAGQVLAMPPLARAGETSATRPAPTAGQISATRPPATAGETTATHPPATAGETSATRPPATAGESRWSEATTAKFPASLGSPVSAGNGFITDEGRRVITLRRLIDFPSVSIWVRNARGELRRARLERQDERASEIATLSLSAPFAANQSLPQEGSAPGNSHGLCFVLGFPSAVSIDAMLPAVTPCFAFDLHAADGIININIALSAAERGSPVFDAQGRLMGLADPSAGAGRSIPVGTDQAVKTPKPLTAVIRTTTGGHSPQSRSPAAGESQATIAMPELYERLAPAIVQVFIVPSGAPTARASE
jgi:hypothetical protein